LTTLYQGMTGPDVKLLQLVLSRFGNYDSRGIDGIFGPLTLRALIDFQGLEGISADGIAGPQTWRTAIPYLTGYRTRIARAGDTFYKIARDNYTTVRAVQWANPQIDPQNIRIGEQIVVPLNFDVVPTNIEYTYKLLEFIVEGLFARYPVIAAENVGKSVMNKNIFSLSIGEGEKKVMINAAHHANEWITTPVVLKFLEESAKSLLSDGEIYGTSAKSLFEQVTLFVVPMVDPDGVDLVNGAIDTNSRIYKNAVEIAQRYPSVPFPSGWKANILGTDLNLNYPAGWEQARDNKFAQGFTSPAPRDFVGTAALSAPESRAMYNYTINYDFNLTISYHSQGEIIFWKYADYEPPRSYEIAVEMGEASGYTVELTPFESGFAGFKDWFIADFNRPGYTIEVGRGQSPLPLEQFDQIYTANYPIMAIGLLNA